MKEFQPNKKILENYAKVLVNFACNKGKGIKKNQTVLLQVSESAKPMLIALRKEVLKAKANAIIHYLPDNIAREYYEIASEQQLKFFPGKYLKGLIDEIDQSILIISETNKRELEGINPKKIMLRQKAFKPYIKWKEEKENKKKYSWTIALYGTKEMAKEVNLSLKEYWQEIIKACYLNEKNPVKKWQEIQKELTRLKNKLNELKIEKVRIQAKNTDLTIKIGKNRKWLSGRGANIPSFEVFISPDWRGTNGKIQFTEPLYVFDNLVKGVYLEFKKGKVIKATAKKGQKILREMIKTKNADKIGEFSLTDARLSKITKFMGTTLFDENVGGKNGNTHIALGNAYKESFPGNLNKVSEKKWKTLGYNSSVIHTDIVATSNRTITATLKNKKKLVIYKNGKFLI